MRASVCMATFNGEKYIEEQLISILKQLSDDDEVIICDDLSSDETVQIIQSLNDSRIKLINNVVRLGHVRNFEKTLFLASGDCVFLADQDDIWPDGRLFSMMNALEKNGVVVGNFNCIPKDSSPKRFIEEYSSNSVVSILNIIFGRVPYFGSAMGFRRSELHYLMPFPKEVEAHDLWVAINANIRGVMVHLSSVVLYRRLHANNLTPRNRRGLRDVIWSRLLMIRLMQKSFFQKWSMRNL